MNPTVYLTLALALAVAPAVRAQSAGDAFSSLTDSIVANNILAKYNLTKHGSDRVRRALATNGLSVSRRVLNGLLSIRLAARR